jgi:hypothetical protein
MNMVRATQPREGPESNIGTGRTVQDCAQDTIWTPCDYVDEHDRRELIASKHAKNHESKTDRA